MRFRRQKKPLPASSLLLQRLGYEHAICELKTHVQEAERRLERNRSCFPCLLFPLPFHPYPFLLLFYQYAGHTCTITPSTRCAGHSLTFNRYAFRPHLSCAGGPLAVAPYNLYRKGYEKNSCLVLCLLLSRDFSLGSFWRSSHATSS